LLVTILRFAFPHWQPVYHVRMRVPIIRGLIERRLLVNYRVDPRVLARILPAPFRPKLAGSFGVAGICLIRLSAIRPRWLPAWCGMTSENAAHRIAVEWTDGSGSPQEGVYILRRDSNARVNTWLGGRLFPGVHGRAAFAVDERDDRFSVRVSNGSGAPLAMVRGRVGRTLPSGSVFGSLAEASAWFAAGSVGYSPARGVGHLDGIRLASETWLVEPLDVEAVASSWLEDTTVFPGGSASYDCTLLMRNIRHEWHAVPNLACGTCAA